MPLSPGAKNASFAPFDTKNDHLTKTGSGQRQGKLTKRCAFFRRLQMDGMKGSDSDILQSNVLDSYVDDHSSVSGAARLLFRISSMRY